jgi:glycosyltransferase involved in cell wall biosynthesis
MNIAFISTMSGFTPNVPRWAGCEELWGAAALRLAQRDEMTVGVNVFRWPEEVPQIEALKRAGCLVKARKTLPGLARLGRHLPGRLHSRWLNRFAPELTVITQHQFHTEPEWAERCRRSRLPYVLVIQSVDEAVALGEAERRTLAANYEQARRCYFVAERNRAVVERVLGLRLAKAAIVRNPFKAPHHDPSPYPAPEGGLALACVARLDHAKGHDLLLEVLAQGKWRSRPLRVDCFGNGSLAESLLAQARALELGSVRFRGFISDVRAIWAEHHALVLASRAEGLPLAIVEAMLCERPCIATDVGGIAELVTDGVTGFIAPKPSVADLDAALERAWARRADLQAMGRAAGEHAREMIPADPGADFARELLSLLHAAD